MRDCPACHADLRAFRSEGNALLACPRCRGLWFEAAAVDALLLPSAIEGLRRSMSGASGACRGCKARIDVGDACNGCGRRACCCPSCDRALVVVEGGGVRGECCERCQGLWLDDGGLQAIARSSSQAARIRAGAFPEILEGAPAPARRSVCSTCDKRLERRTAFEREGTLFCGSCAPSGANPWVGELVLDTSLVEPAPAGLLARLFSLFK